MPPRLARLAAVLAAVGLIVAALVLRSALEGDDEATSDRPDDARSTTEPDEASTGDDAAPYRLACDADLVMTCEALDAVGEVTTLTGAEALETDLDVDAWLTIDPMPAVKAFVDQATEPEEPVALAASEAVLFQSGADVGCDGGDVRCIVEAAAGPVSVGVPGPDTSVGILLRSALTLALTPDIDVAGVSSVADEDVALLRRAVDGRAEDMADQVTRFLTQRGSYVGILTTQGTIEGRTRPGYTSVPLVPEVTLGVVVVGYGGRGPQAAAAVRDAVSRETLALDGFDGEPSRSTGVPARDIVYALREELG